LVFTLAKDAGHREDPLELALPGIKLVYRVVASKQPQTFLITAASDGDYTSQYGRIVDGKINFDNTKIPVVDRGLPNDVAVREQVKNGVQLFWSRENILNFSQRTDEGGYSEPVELIRFERVAVIVDIALSP
jgi:hypothetical protein